MDKTVKILFAGAFLWWGFFRAANSLIVGIKSWSFRALDLTTGTVDITLNFLIKNPLFFGITLKAIYGDVYVQGQKVGEISTTYNYYLSGGHTHQIPVIVRLNLAGLGQAALMNIQSGDVRTLTLAFDGRLVAGSAGVAVPINIAYNWEDLTA